MFIHHAIMVAKDDDVFAVRARARARGYEIDSISEPQDWFRSEEMQRLVDISKPLLDADQEDVERRAIATMFPTWYNGSLTYEK